jgi:hypothetical protein
MASTKNRDLLLVGNMQLAPLAPVSADQLLEGRQGTVRIGTKGLWRAVWPQRTSVLGNGFRQERRDDGVGHGDHVADMQINCHAANNVCLLTGPAALLQ